MCDCVWIVCFLRDAADNVIYKIQKAKKVQRQPVKVCSDRHVHCNLYVHVELKIQYVFKNLEEDFECREKTVKGW